MSSTFSGTRFPGWYFAIQGLAIACWWLFLWRSPSAAELFTPPGAGSVDFLSFWIPDLLIAVPASSIAALTFFLRSRWSVPMAWAAAGALDYAFFYCLAWSWYRHGGWLSVVLMAPAALFSTVCAIDASAAFLPIFRRSAPGPPSRHVAATLMQIALFWSILLFVVPAAIAAVEHHLRWPVFAFAGQQMVAVLLLGLCSALGLTSGITMAVRGAGTPLPFAATNRLVVNGPYAYLRNPMVVAGLGQGLAVGVWLGSPAVIAYVIAGGLIWNCLVRPAEERDLLETFGQEFAAYRAEVKCWIPRLRMQAHLRHDRAGENPVAIGGKRQSHHQHDSSASRMQGESMDNVAFVKSLYEAFGRGEIPTVLGAMSPNIRWHQAEGNPYMPSGEAWVGPDAVMNKLFMRLGAEWDGFSVHPRRFHGASGSVIVEGRYTGTYKATGKSMDAQFCHVWDLENGKLTRFQQYLDTAKVQDVMGAR